MAIQSVEALRGFSLDVPAGAMVGLVGRNGAGKTTLMRTVMGHLAVARGRMRFDGPRPRRACPATAAPRSASATCPRTAGWCRS